MSTLDRLLAALPALQRELAAADRAVQYAQAELTTAELAEQKATHELKQATALVAQIHAERLVLEVQADGLLTVLAVLRGAQP